MLLMNLPAFGSSVHFRFCFCILVLGEIGMGNSISQDFILYVYGQSNNN